MQCHSCTFENMPGAQMCARCQSLLNLDKISVIPQRANQKGITATQKEKFHSFLHKERSQLVQFFIRFIFQRHYHPQKISLLLTFLVPGLGHYIAGEKKEGAFIFTVWITLILFLFITVASNPFYWFLLGIVLYHSYIILTLIRDWLSTYAISVRLLIGFTLAFFMQFVYYSGAIETMGNFSRVLPLNHLKSSSHFENGDIILYQGTWTRENNYQQGDLVVYQLNKGYGLDRIIGIPGDHIEVREGILYVNDVVQAKEKNPLGKLPPFGLKIHLLPEEYCIFPSLMNIHTNDGGERFLESYTLSWSRVSQGNILGKATWRIRPLNRFGSLE